MADNSPMGGTDTIATDEVATLNGGASTGVKVPREKVGYGDDGDYRDVSDAYPLPTRKSSDTATLTSVAAAIASTTVLAANPSRRGLLLHAVSSSGTCYVRLGGGTASAALGGHTFDLAPSYLYEDPNGFTGAVTAIWSSAAGGLNITELT